MDDIKEETGKICECGYEDNSFACRIRHQNLNVANLKRARESDSNFGLVEQQP